MSQFQIRFPPLCAWCGMRKPEDTRDVSVSRSFGRRTVRLQFKAPICPECAQFANALRENQKKVNRVVFIGAFAVALVASFFLAKAGGELGMMVVFWPTIGLVFMMIAWAFLAITKLRYKFEHRGLSEPPVGYMSADYNPCHLVGYHALQFHNPQYQALFTAANPGLVRAPKK